MNDVRLSVKARIVILAAKDHSCKEIATILSERPNTVSLWRKRFAEEGMKGLLNRPRGHTKTEYGALLPERLASLFHRKDDSSICLKTLADRFVSEGKRIDKNIDMQIRQILVEHDFDPDTALPLNNNSENTEIPSAVEEKKASQKFKENIEFYNEGKNDSDKIKDNELVDKTETDSSNCVLSKWESIRTGGKVYGCLRTAVRP